MRPIRWILLLGLVWLAGLAQGQGGSDASFFAPNRWAVVIGASAYPELGDLPFAASDAESFAGALVGEYEFEPDKVTVLTDKRERAEEKPTVERINQVLDEILGDPRLDKGDLLVFYFSGHGVGAGGTDLLLPTDATFENYQEVGLPVKSIIERIAKSGVRNVVLITDACRSGDRNPFGGELVSLGREANIAIILGTEPGGESYELPQFGMGAMTYALIQAMKDESLGDPETGALWISTLAKKVQRDVEARTAQEKGQEDRQIPSVYCRKNQDILLGGFVGRSKYGAELESFIRSQGQELDREVYSRLLHSLALEAMEAGRAQAAVDALRTVRELGDSWGGLLAMEAVSLDWLGREAESEAVFAQLLQQFPDDYHAQLHRALNTVDPDERLAAAEAFWEMYHDFTAAMALMTWERNSPGTSPERRAELAARLAEGFEEESGPWIYFKAYEVVLTVDPDELLAQFTEIEDLPGVRREYVELLIYELALQTGDDQKIVDTIGILMQNPVSRQIWEYYERSHILRLVTDENREELGRFLMEGDETGERLWTAVCVWGEQAGEFVEEVRAVADERPFSVRAQSALFFAELMAEKPDRFGVPEELRVLGLDEPDLVADLMQQIALASQGDWTFLRPIEGYTWARIAMEELLAYPNPYDQKWLEAYVTTAIRLQREDLLWRMAVQTLEESPASLFWLDVAVSSFLMEARPELALEALRKFSDVDQPTVWSGWTAVEGWYLIRGMEQKAEEVAAEREGLGLELSEEMVAGLNALRAGIAGDAEALVGLREQFRDPLTMDFLNWAECRAGLVTPEQLVGFVTDGDSAYPWMHGEFARIVAEGLEGDAVTGFNLFLMETPDFCYAGVPYVDLGFDVRQGEVEVFGQLLWNGNDMVAVTGVVRWTDGKATLTLDQAGKSLVFEGQVSALGYCDLTGEVDGEPVQVRIRVADPAWWKEQIWDLSYGYILGSGGGFGALNLQRKDD